MMTLSEPTEVDFRTIKITMKGNIFYNVMVQTFYINHAFYGINSEMKTSVTFKTYGEVIKYLKQLEL